MDLGDDFLTQSREYINTRYIVDNAFRGVMARFARRIDRTPQQVGGMLNDNPTRPIGRGISEHMESCLGLPSGWLSQSHNIEELERGAAVVRKLLAADGGDASPNKTDLRRTVRPSLENIMRRRRVSTGAASYGGLIDDEDLDHLDEDLPPMAEEAAPGYSIRAEYRRPIRDTYQEMLNRRRLAETQPCRIERALRLGGNDVDVIRGLAYDAGKNRVVQRLLNRVGGNDDWYTALLYDDSDHATVILVTLQEVVVVANGDEGYTVRVGKVPEAALAAEDAKGSLAIRYTHLLIVRQTCVEKPIHEAAVIITGGQAAVNEAIRTLTFEGLEGITANQLKL